VRDKLHKGKHKNGCAAAALTRNHGGGGGGTPAKSDAVDNSPVMGHGQVVAALGDLVWGAFRWSGLCKNEESGGGGGAWRVQAKGARGKRGLVCSGSKGEGRRGPADRCVEEVGAWWPTSAWNRWMQVACSRHRVWLGRFPRGPAREVGPASVLNEFNQKFK
jgi:hypothetical protein